MENWSFLAQAWGHLVQRTSALVPTLLATVLLVVGGWLFALLVAAVARKLLLRIQLDRWMGESGLPESLDSYSPTTIISRVLFWLVFLCFTVVAIENLGLDLSDLPIRSFIAYLPALLGAVLLLVGGILVATFLGRGTAAALSGMGIDHHRQLGQLVRGLVIALTTVLVVEQLGFDVTALTQTFSNLLVVVAAGLVFAFAWGGREVARNVLAGYYIREQFRPGDRVQVDGHEGVLEEVGSLNTRLRNARGEVIVPNSRLVEQTVARTREMPTEEGPDAP